MLCLGQFVLTDQVPGTFGGKSDDDEQRDRPYPLNSEWNPVGPLIRPILHTDHDSGGEELTHDPTQVNICREVSSETDGRDVGGVRDG